MLDMIGVDQMAKVFLPFQLMGFAVRMESCRDMAKKY